MDDAPTVRRETFIAAPPATVFAYLTDPEKIVSWMGAHSLSEPRPGGVYVLEGVSRRKRTVRGAFREVVPVHRLAYSFGWDDSETVRPGSSLVEIDLLDENGGTRMTMTHSGLPDEAQCAQHAIGWAHYLNRLAVVAAGGDPGPDPM